MSRVSHSSDVQSWKLKKTFYPFKFNWHNDQRSYNIYIKDSFIHSVTCGPTIFEYILTSLILFTFYCHQVTFSSAEIDFITLLFLKADFTSSNRWGL